MKNRCLVIILILEIIIGLTIYRITLKNYAFTIKLNWDIKLPITDKQIYYKGSESVGFHGDGCRYSILKYSSKSKKKKLEKINWINQKNEDIENQAKEIMNEIDIASKYNIDFNKQYVYFIKISPDHDGMEKIILIYIKEENRIYTIEQLI